MRKKGEKNLFSLGEKMKYYVKKFLIFMVYLISSGVIGTSIFLIEGTPWLKLVLLILNLSLFMLVYCGIALKDGEKALKVRISNDKIRELIVNTGDDYKLDLDGEFTIRKGFIAGATACLPLIVLLLLNLVVKGATNTIIVQAVQLFYMVFYGFFNLDFAGAHVDVLYASINWTLISIPILIIAQGVFFYLGAKKAERQQERIKITHRHLHGE